MTPGKNSMKTNNLKHFDEMIKKRVQAVEQDIPAALEKTFMEKMDEPYPAKKRTNRVFIRTLAAAASLLIVVLLAVTLLFHPVQTPAAVEKEVFIDYATVEGQPATTYIVNQQDPDMTIVWIEKAPMTAMNTNK